LQPQKVLLVDDIVTKGCTLLACSSRVQEAFPDAEIPAFAMLRTMGLVRTMGLGPDIERIVDPCVGLITAEFGTPIFSCGRK